MKKIIYIDSFIDLEREYMNNQNAFLIEEELLYSFSKEELKSLIETIKEEYLKEKLPYSFKLQRKRVREWYEELNKISKYFIDIIEYYFSGWQELELTKVFIDRLTRFYKVNYQLDNRFRKQIDIKSIPISEILSMYMKVPDNLRRNIRCPFIDHRDNSASFRIYKNTNSFYCYWCHRWWNIVNFISFIENISTKEAFKKIAQLYSNY